MRWLRKLLGGGSPRPAEPLFVFVRIPEVIGPLERGDKYEDPLGEALVAAGVGATTGGGTSLSAPDADGNRHVEWVGVDVELTDPERGIEICRRELRRLGAPVGTVLEFRRGDADETMDVHAAP